MDNKEFSKELARSHVLRGNVSLDALRRTNRLFYVLVCSLMITIRVGGMDKLVCLCNLAGSILQIEPKRFGSGYKPECSEILAIFTSIGKK